jgi:linoleoyl-CoA desaturase
LPEMTPNHSTGGPERVSFDGDGEFLRTVRARVHLALGGKHAAGDARLQRKAALILVWFFGSFILLLSVTPVWLQYALWFSYGLAASAVGFNIFHDANHGAMSSDRRTNLLVGSFAATILGASRYLWNYKHHILHHRFTNIHGWDDDLETRGFLRITSQQEWKPRYRGQHLFVAALYAVNAFELVFIKDWVQYFTLRINEHQRIPPMSRPEKIEFWTGKIIYLAIFLGLPFALLPFAHVLIGLLIYEVTLGLSLALVFSMAHQVESVAFPTPNGANAITEEWGSHQMRTTANFANRHAGWNWYTGGLNHQIEHHLFPAMSHTHYAAIGPIVRRTGIEFGLPYHHFETYAAALHSHYRHLRALSMEPQIAVVVVPAIL